MATAKPQGFLHLIFPQLFYFLFVAKFSLKSILIILCLFILIHNSKTFSKLVLND